jgi:lysyl-tRNA synthetase class 2
MSEQQTQHQQNSEEQRSEEHQLIAQRKSKLAEIRKDCAANGHPNSFRRSAWTQELQQAHAHQDKAELEGLNRKVAVSGRIMGKRGPFMVLQDGAGRIQLYAEKSIQAQTTKSWDVGDIVGVSGPVHKSGKGDLYVHIEEYQLLTKSLRPLPEKFHGIADQEVKYRQRYLDLMTDETTQARFRVRSKIVDYIRRYLNDKSFLEVETPMLQVIPGGATAKPFTTHHNSLDIDMYLRIAPELYLKRLVVGGYERVFEINRNFRNEGLSTRHNPEFTMLEFYQAYSDYIELMDLTEDMLRGMASEVLGSTVVHYQQKDYDLGKPFKRMSVFDSILNFNPDLASGDIDNIESARKVAQNLDIPLKEAWGLGKLQIEIFEKTVEHRLDEPTFITQYPTEVSPLARRNDDNPHVTDRFEFFIGGREIANGFSELNDAEDQAQRFEAQVQEKDAGDDEAMFYDEDYVTALEYGLPPTAGEGIGIDRLVMFFTDTHTIKDVILFPHMKPKAEDTDH